MDTDKMMTYGTFTMDDEKTHTVIIKHNRIGSLDKYSINHGICLCFTIIKKEQASFTLHYKKTEIVITGRM